MLRRVLTFTFLKLFVRDGQALFFSLFFPILFMVIFGFVSDREPDPVRVGIAQPSPDTDPAPGTPDGDTGDARALADMDEFIASLQNNPAFRVSIADEQTLRQRLIDGELSLVLILPEHSDGDTPTDLQVLADTSQVRQQGLVLAALEQGLVQVERDLRNVSPMFNLQVRDVQARSQRYIDFLVPGLLAMSLLTLSLAGSAFNIVEYRRKGILKRLFVTPLQPRDFILGMVASRGLICIVELALLLAIAWFYLQVGIQGNPLTLLLIIILGAAVFLSLGFSVASLAKSQQAVGALGNLVIFPQIFLSGIFYPVSSLPGFLQSLAGVLPLTFVTNAMRGVMTDGATLMELFPDFVGMIAWLVIGLLLAVRLFVWKDIAS
jgi:ABC-2 type transport system permease protein